jgi:membrane-bound ClpP family serine protease
VCLISDAKKPYSESDAKKPYSENEPSLTYRIASVIKNPIPIPIYLIVLSFILAFTFQSKNPQQITK